MSALALTAPSGTGIRWQEDGASEDAARIRLMLKDTLEHMFNAASTGAAYHSGSAGLAELEIETSEEDWNSKGAQPLDPMSVVSARRFLTLMPTSFPGPYVAADPDGEVSFEWEGNRGALFSISFSAGQTIAYAGNFGSARVKGIEYFGDDIPEAIVEGLRRALAGR